jgi:hypothetical protein
LHQWYQRVAKLDQAVYHHVRWGKVWPEGITEFTVPCIGDALQDIVQLAHRTAVEGFEDVQPQGLQ